MQLLAKLKICMLGIGLLTVCGSYLADQAPFTITSPPFELQDDDIQASSDIQPGCEEIKGRTFESIIAEMEQTENSSIGSAAPGFG